MPRLADHEQRRREITDAARRVIARGGLESATFQSVAAEAGISVRLVQYYFGTKKDFLRATHLAVSADAGDRFAQRFAALGEAAEPRDVIYAMLEELLPMNEARRRDTIVLGAFQAASLAGSGLSMDETLGGTRWLIAAVAEQLRRSCDSADTDRDATLIVLAAAALTQSMVAGVHTNEAATELLEHLLHRIPGPDAARRSE
ncbi:TetR/AcrR family transcriptional regulator [Nocardia lijiangensis]|uniref:TetR/AcrR family transcriptional regulator n=1 Tax=Nocardia lijiangensis TaxID=299618 RepID=UPI00082F3685|nr:TetR/AcrR family transcriptional regulator [Nocardia lijiangensis]